MLKRSYMILSLIAALGVGVTYAQDSAGYKDKQKEKERAWPQSEPTVQYIPLPMEASERSYLGVFLEEVTSERAKELGLSEERGAIVMKVAEGSPAEKAGLKKDDVIVSYNGRRVDSVRELQRLLGETPAGRSVNLEVARGGSKQSLTATLTKRSSGFNMVAPKIDDEFFKESDETRRRADEMAKRYRERIPGAAPEFGNFNLFERYGLAGFHGTRLGVSLESLTDQLADFFGIKDGKGILVTEVYENRPAAKAGLKAGDVIVAVDGKKVENIDTLVTAITEKEEGTLTLTILRNRSEQKITVTLEKREPRRIQPPRRTRVITETSSSL